VVATSVTALMAALQGAGLATTPVVIGLALVLGLTVAFAIPAIQAMVPDLVAPEDLGSALAAVTVAGRFRDPLRRLPVGCLGMGLAMVGFGLAPTVPVAFAALAAGGFCFMATNTAATTALMREAVPEQRGRVMALWSLCFLGTRPLASLGDGAVASAAGLRVAAVALAAPVLIAAAATSRLHARTDPGARPSGVKEIP
jgi:hypothetical protein